MMSSAPDQLKTSAAFLTAVNLVCAAVGAGQGLAVVRLLGPEGFGSAAVLVSLTAVATNLIDVRLTDLVSNLYYSPAASDDTRGAAYRASALRLGIGLYAVSAPLIMLASAALMLIGARHLSTTTFLTQWFWLAAAAQGISYFGSFFVFIQRFATSAWRMAALQVASALMNAGAMIACVMVHRTIGGYVTGLLLSAIAIAVVNTVLTIRSIGRAGIPLLHRRPQSDVVIDRKVVFQFIAAGNVLGYVKLLHRSADVLLVAFFCSDRDTGIYKLARSMTDGLYAISEAVGRTYQPRLLSLLRDGAHSEYRRLARSMAAMAACITVVALAGVLIVVPRMAFILGWRDMPGLTLATAVLTLPFFFVAGLQAWIWPAFVSLGRLGRCTLWGVVAVVMGQYTVGPLLVYSTGSANPAWFSVGYLSFYILSLLPLWRELVHEGHSFAWIAREAAA
jgi:O-antigen/teichoic acid export membrane protein